MIICSSSRFKGSQKTNDFNIARTDQAPGWRMPRPHLRLLKLCGHDVWSTKGDLTATRQGATESGGIDGGGMVQECPGHVQYASIFLSLSIAVY